MPKWWNEQQVCQTYTREPHTVGARTRVRKARTAKRAHGNGGGAHGNGGANGNGRRARPRGCARQWGARTATGSAHARGGVRGNGGRARPRGAYARAPNDGRSLTPRGCCRAHTCVPIIRVANGGGCMAPRRSLYMFCSCQAFSSWLLA
jgi:hypothetical protein